MLDFMKVKKLGNGEYGFTSDVLDNIELVELINSLRDWDFDLLYDLASRAGRTEEYYNIRGNYCMNSEETRNFFNSICDDMQINRIDF